MYLKRLHISDFIKPDENAATYPEMPDAFEVYVICNSKNPTDSTFLENLRNYDKNDRKVFRAGLSKLLKIANKGEPLRVHYTEKQLHDMHTFTYKGKEHKVLRIRSGDTRLAFFHVGKLILLLDAFVKHKDFVTEQQKSFSEATVKRYIDAKSIDFIQE